MCKLTDGNTFAEQLSTVVKFPFNATKLEFLLKFSFFLRVHGVGSLLAASAKSQLSWGQGASGQFIAGQHRDEQGQTSPIQCSQFTPQS